MVIILKRKYKLSNRELEVMQVLWNSKEPLAATDIPTFNPNLNLSTVQVSLRKLIEKSYIKVADIIYHGTVLTRIYEPVLSQDDYMTDYFESSSLKPEMFIASLVKRERNIEVLDKLENLIAEHKKKLKDDEK